MSSYTFLEPAPRPAAEPRTVYLISSGDLRQTSCRDSWPRQQEVEAAITEVFANLGWSVCRAHKADPVLGHGLISSQHMGMEVFKNIPPEAPLVVAESNWQYSHHVLAGLRTHRGPILTVANFSGTYPGLVGLLGLNASLTKARVPFSTTWSVDFRDEWFRSCIQQWLDSGRIDHDTSHVRALPELPDSEESRLGACVARRLLVDKAIVGVFDEGCMGMYNAIIDDELMNGIGLYKERLSQSALWAEMLTVDGAEADAVRQWLEDRGMVFRIGIDETTELTDAQVREACAMYVAALRIADDFGLNAVGIQYQQGLKDICAASDLAEGMMNNVERPPVRSRDGARELFPQQALPTFNEADEGAGVDALITNRVWTAMGLDPATTLHDVRWGEEFDGQFVWVWEISGAVPASHLIGGYRGAEGWRQSPVSFPHGGPT
ncbi:MAG: fucose isomerase, partial [Micrococcales bacterium]|nr:fucose isomerase [Micrococcales bacterium]